MRPVPSWPLTLEVSLPPNVWFETRTLHISGVLALSQGFRAGKKFDEGRWVWGLDIQSLRVDGIDAEFVDLVPVIYGSYFVPLTPQS